MDWKGRVTFDVVVGSVGLARERMLDAVAKDAGLVSTSRLCGSSLGRALSKT